MCMSLVRCYLYNRMYQCLVGWYLYWMYHSLVGWYLCWTCQYHSSLIKMLFIVFWIAMILSLIQRENGDVLLKKGDFVIYSEHVIEIVAKTALLYQKALNHMPPIHIEAQYVDLLSSFYYWRQITFIVLLNTAGSVGSCWIIVIQA